MPIYTDEISIYNADAIEQAIGDSRDYYITEITGDGIWVTPHDARPSNGQATSTTRGWHIADALEYFRGTVRYIKAWLNGTVPTIRLGQDTAGHADVTPSGLEVFAGTNGADSMAKFGSETRIGKSNGARFVTNASSLQAYDSDSNKYFEVSATGLTYGTFDAASKAEVGDVSGRLTELNGYVRVENGSLVLGKVPEAGTQNVGAVLSNDGLVFYPMNSDGTFEMTPISSFVIENNEGVMVIHRAVVVNELRFDNWAWRPRINGNLSLKWIGE